MAKANPFATGLRDANYIVSSGDINGDGIDDLLFRARDQFGFVSDDFIVPVFLWWRSSFIVMSGRGGAYSIRSDVTVSDLTDPRWTAGAHQLQFVDPDRDGIEEMVASPISGSGIAVLIGNSPTKGISFLKSAAIRKTNAVNARPPTSAPSGLAISGAPAAATVPGATRGNFEIDPAGGARYEIPIWMPGGPNGVQPSLSIRYDSTREHGSMGPGWSINGFSAINRCVKTFAQDGAPAPILLTSTDGYCLDGKRLRLTSGTYGATGSKYQTERADFSEITANGAAGGGPAYFVVRSKNGLTYEYGNSNDGGSTNTARISGESSSTPYQWQLNKVLDRNGNRFIVTYSTGQAGSVGIGTPLQVDYTPVTYGSTSYRYRVEFTYTTDSVDGTEIGYVAGGRTVDSNLLTRIDVRRLDVPKNLRTYSFAYSSSPTTNRSRLTSVQECSDTALTSCLTATAVSYQDGAAGVSGGGLAVSDAAAIKGFYDINGDGRQDIVFIRITGTGLFTKSTLYVSLATATGFGSPISTGLVRNGVADTNLGFIGAADMIASGRADIMAGDVRYSWNGTGFTATSTGVSDGGQLSDINGDGLPDLISYSGKTVYSRLNTSTAGVLSFAATRTVAWTCSLTLVCTAGGSTIRAIASETSQKGRRDAVDFNGDGRKDILVSVYDGSSQTYTYPLISNGSTYGNPSFPYGQGVNRDISTFSLVHWNDDECTDVIDNISKSIAIAGCNGGAALSVAFQEPFIGVIDWDGDGRTDLIVDTGIFGGQMGIRRSTGGGVGSVITTGLTSPVGLAVFDQNGDGLDDIATIGSSSVYYQLHSGAGAPADLASSITDGYGMSYSPSYASIVLGSYTKGTGAIAPERDVLRPLYVVSQVQASDGIGGTFSRTYAYAGGREDIQGRGFSGFQSRTTTDSRTLARVEKSFFKTAFPYTGLAYQKDILQNNGVTLIKSAVSTPAVMTLSSTSGQQRYFPFVQSSLQSVYEVGGAKNGALVQQTNSSFTYDTYGNLTSSTEIVSDKDGISPQSPTFNQTWTTTVATTVSPDATNWCLGIPTQVTVAKSGSNVASITRTTSVTPDYVKCRMTQAIIEPASPTYKVTRVVGYDAFGNLNSQAITGIGMTARTETADWGITGQYPETLTNAEGNLTSIARNYDLGVQSSITDPNTLVTSFAYDPFGRVTGVTRPEGTSTTYQYSICSAVAGGCQNGDPGSSAVSINKLVVIATERSTGGAALRDDWTYLDQLDRPIVTKAKAFNGSYSRTGTQYDGFGREYRETAPCDASACTVYWTTNAFDPIDRITAQSRPVSASDPTVQTTSFGYLGLTTTITDAQGKVSTRAEDPRGQLRRSKDHDGYYQSFTYDAFGSLTAITDSQSNVLFSATYDYGLGAFRRQTVDMDLGTWNYVLNALGETTAYTDANGSTFSSAFDKLSRPITRTEPGSTTTWTYGASVADRNVGKLRTVTSTGATTETYSYDNFGRPSQLQVVSDATYTYNASYNASTGQLDTLTYPTSTSGYRLMLQYAYVNGLLERVSDYNAPSTVFWRAANMNSRFQVTSEALGNGVVTNSAFDSVTGWVSAVQSGPSGGSALQNDTYQYDRIGNLTQRKDINRNLTEAFTYDNVYRLDYSKLNGVTNLDLAYDALGNITQKCEPTCGTTWTYSSTKKHAVTQASVGGSTYTYGYDNNGNVTSRHGNSITWNKSNFPTLINGTGESVAISYDASMRRWKQIYTQGGAIETTVYVGQLLEKVTNGGATDWRHYVQANGKNVAIVSRNSSGTNATRYLLEDHQGSVDEIVNSSGTPVVGESFTAFGGRRNPTSWTGAPSVGDLATINGISRAGFTGHEALGALGLNHMNGRVQDAITGRFLSADPFISDPLDTQSFNRFSYVNNNPLSYTDPTGYWSVKKAFKKGVKKLKRAAKRVVRAYVVAQFAGAVCAGTEGVGCPAAVSLALTYGIENAAADDSDDGYGFETVPMAPDFGNGSFPDAIGSILGQILGIGSAEAAGLPSPPFNVDLLLHEGLGGHTYREHVGKDVDYLRRRVDDRGRSLEVASSYRSLREATAVTNQTLNSEYRKIQECLENDRCGGGVVRSQFRRSTGYAVYDARGQPVDVFSATVVFQRNPALPEGFLILTSFPSPP